MTPSMVAMIVTNYLPRKVTILSMVKMGMTVSMAKLGKIVSKVEIIAIALVVAQDRILSKEMVVMIFSLVAVITIP